MKDLAANRIFVQKAKNHIFSKGTSFGEKAAAATVFSLIGLKEKVVMGVKKVTKKRKKSSRKLPIAKRSGFLMPLTVEAVSAGSALYNAYANLKNNEKILQEQMLHHKVMEDLKIQGKDM